MFENISEIGFCTTFTSLSTYSIVPIWIYRTYIFYICKLSAVEFVEWNMWPATPASTERYLPYQPPGVRIESNCTKLYVVCVAGWVGVYRYILYSRTIDALYIVMSEERDAARIERKCDDIATTISTNNSKKTTQPIILPVVLYPHPNPT
jgi:hypothetical protein